MSNTIHIDIEATTKYPNNAKVLEFAYIITSEPFTANIIDMGHFYFSPESEVPYSSVLIHGLNKAKLDILSDGKQFYQLANEVRKKFDGCTYISGYNSNTYDVPVLNREFDQAGVRNLFADEFKYLDYCRKARSFQLPTANTRLSTLYRYAISKMGLRDVDVEDLFQDCLELFDVSNACATAHGAMFDTFMLLFVNMYLHSHGYPC